MKFFFIFTYFLFNFLASPEARASAVQKNLSDEQKVLALFEKLEVKRAGTCSPPGVTEDERVLECITKHNKAYVQSHKERLEKEIENLKQQNKDLEAMKSTSGLNYKKWMIEDNNKLIENKKASLTFYNAASFELDCANSTKYSDMPIFENFDQMFTYMVEKAKLTMPPRSFRIQSKYSTYDERQPTNSSVKLMGAALRSKSIQSQNPLNAIEKGHKIQDDEVVQILIEFFEDNEVKELVSKFPLHGDWKPRSIFSTTQSPESEKLIHNHPKLAESLFRNSKQFFNQLKQNPKALANFQDQMTVAKSLINNDTPQLLDQYFANAELAKMLDFEITSVTPGTKISPDQFSAYQDQVEKVKNQTLNKLNDLKDGAQSSFRLSCLSPENQQSGKEFEHISLYNPINYVSELFYRAGDGQSTIDEIIRSNHSLNTRMKKTDIESTKLVRSSFSNYFSRELNQDDPIERDISLLKQNQHWIQQRHSVAQSSFKQNHNQSISSSEQRFVAEVTVSRELSMKKFTPEIKAFHTTESTDLRYLFNDAPNSQLQSKACMPMAISHQLQTASVNAKGDVTIGPEVSTSTLYGLLKVQEAGVKLESSDLKKDFLVRTKPTLTDTGESKPLEQFTDAEISAKFDKGLQLANNSDISYDRYLLPFTKYSLPLAKDHRSELPPLHIPKQVSTDSDGYRISQLQSISTIHGKGPSLDVITKAIDGGAPLIATISNSERTAHEGWLRFNEGSKYSHVLQVVKYGRGIDPYDGKEKDYFTVRDSLCEYSLDKKCPTYSIPAYEFMDSLMHLQDVQASQLNN